MNTTYSYDEEGNVVKGKDDESTFKLSDTEISKCKEIIANGGSRDEVLDYLNAKGNLPLTDEDDITLDNILGLNGGSEKGNKAPMATGTVKNFRTVEGDNFDVTVNGKDYSVENKGKVKDEATIKKLNQVGGTDKSVFLYNGDAYAKYAGGYYKIGATNILFWKTGGYQDLLSAMQK
jgi:hypothetical protein